MKEGQKNIKKSITGTLFRIGRRYFSEKQSVSKKHIFSYRLSTQGIWVCRFVRALAEGKFCHFKEML